MTNKLPNALIRYLVLGTRHSIERLLLLAVLLGYLIVAALFAVFTPPWQTPDEPAHYNYVAQVAAAGCCPKIEPGDWDSAYLERLKATHFSPELLDRLDTIQYEDHQPPLYYLLASAVFKLTGGSLIALRLFSALIGLVVVWCAYAIGKIMLPERPQVALGMAALVAFLPQHVAILASVNNDCLAWALVGVTLLATVTYLRTDDENVTQRHKEAKWNYFLVSSVSRRFVLILGILVGLGFVAKASTYFLAILVPLVIVLKWWSQRRNGAWRALSLRPLARELALFALPALTLGAVWWARDIAVYGFPDFLGLRAHDTVVADQPRTAARIAEIGFGPYVSESLEITFNSFWGQFGWMGLPMPDWMYSALLAFTLAASGGLAADRFIPRDLTPSASLGRGQAEGVDKRSAWLILTLAALLAVLQYLYYNTEFRQLQGRYLFTGLIPFALGMALGVDAWRRLILGRFAWAHWITAAVFLPLALLDVYLLWRFIVPLLSP